MSTRARLGRRAEAIAADYLIRQGFDIVGQNVRLGPLEIDIVARKDDLVVVVEVRTRGRRAYEGALASITPKKRLRLVSAAERLWREKFASDESVQRMRFDVIAVRFVGETAEIEHIAAAFTAS
jgi:putative endonuclease